MEVKRGVSRAEAKALGDRLGVDWGEIPLAAFQAGLKVEREHGDVTGGDPLATAKIALAHLKERPDYYARLKHVEKAVRPGLVLSPSKKNPRVRRWVKVGEDDADQEHYPASSQRAANADKKHETLLLYHVTFPEAADAIHREGFRASANGELGPGVYLTHTPEQVTGPKYQGKETVAVPVRIGDTRLLTIPFSANGPLAALRALYGSEKAEKRMREITRDPALWAKRWEVIQKDAQAAGYGGFELKGGPAWAAKNVVIFAAKDAVPIKPAAAMNGEVEKAVRLNGTPFFPLLLSKALRVKAEHGGGEVVGIDHLSHDAGSGMGHYAVHVRDKDGNVTTKHWLLHHSVVQRAVQHRSNTGGVRVKRVYQSAYRAPQRAKNSPGGQIPAAGAKNAAAGASAPVAAKVAAAPGARNGSAAGTAPGKAPEGAKPAQTPRTIPQPAAGANPTAAQGQAPQPLQTRFFGMKRQGAQLHLQHSPVGFAGKQLHESPLTKITHQGDVAGSEDAIYHGHAASGKVYAFRAKKADMAQWGNYMDEESRLHHQEVAGGAKQAGAKPPVVRKEPLIR